MFLGSPFLKFMVLIFFTLILQFITFFPIEAKRPGLKGKRPNSLIFSKNTTEKIQRQFSGILSQFKRIQEMPEQRKRELQEQITEFEQFPSLQKEKELKEKIEKFSKEKDFQGQGLLEKYKKDQEVKLQYENLITTLIKHEKEAQEIFNRFISGVKKKHYFRLEQFFEEKIALLEQHILALEYLFEKLPKTAYSASIVYSYGQIKEMLEWIKNNQYITFSNILEVIQYFRDSDKAYLLNQIGKKDLLEFFLKNLRDRRSYENPDNGLEYLIQKMIFELGLNLNEEKRFQFKEASKYIPISQKEEKFSFVQKWALESILEYYLSSWNAPVIFSEKGRDYLYENYVFEYLKTGDIKLLTTYSYMVKRKRGTEKKLPDLIYVSSLTAFPIAQGSRSSLLKNFSASIYRLATYLNHPKIVQKHRDKIQECFNLLGQIRKIFEKLHSVEIQTISLNLYERFMSLNQNGLILYDQHSDWLKEDVHFLAVEKMLATRTISEMIDKIFQRLSEIEKD